LNLSGQYRAQQGLATGRFCRRSALDENQSQSLTATDLYENTEAWLSNKKN
jgi:hypothetical protein